MPFVFIDDKKYSKLPFFRKSELSKIISYAMDLKILALFNFAMLLYKFKDLLLNYFVDFSIY